jgi:hypothetical protein
MAVPRGGKAVGWCRPGKGVLWVVELTLRARTSALGARKPLKRDRAEARGLRP